MESCYKYKAIDSSVMLLLLAAQSFWTECGMLVLLFTNDSSIKLLIVKCNVNIKVESLITA